MSIRFMDRESAGAALARLLAPRYKGRNVVVYALPRGGVPIAAPIAKVLSAPLELIITRKIGHPHDPEYALGALTEDGDVLWETLDREGVDEWWLASVIDVEKEEAARRRNVYLGGAPRQGATGKVAIIVDDGAATGLTIRAAIRSLKKENPKELVVALPVAPHGVVEALRNEVDNVVVAEDVTGDFRAVGLFYGNFAQVSDAEVMALFGRSLPRPVAPAGKKPRRSIRHRTMHTHY